MPEAIVDFEFVRCSEIEGEDAQEDPFLYTAKDDNLMLSVGDRIASRRIASHHIASWC